MIKEAYCSFEVSKLLKEKGFVGSRDIGCKDGFYSESAYESGYGIVTSSGQEVGLVFDDLDNSDLEWNEYLRPTQSLAMAWLREEKNLYIEIRRNLNTFYFKWYIQEGAAFRAFSEYKYESYEKTIEEALKYTLENLI